MSEENLELIQRAYEMFDAEDLASGTELFDPAVEVDVSRTNPEGGLYRGAEGFQELMTQWLGPWDDYSLELLELIDAGKAGVVAVAREKGRIKGSDTWTEQTRGSLWTIRDGRISGYTEYQDRDAALEAAGLAE
jgi:ketosteroid isomerase-like protein